MFFYKFDKVLNNLSKKIFFTLLSILQFAFAFSIIYMSFQLFIDYKNVNQNIVKSFGSSNLYSIRKNETSIEKLYDKKTVTDYNDLFKTLNKKYNMINMSCDNFFVEKFNGVSNFAIPNSPSQNIENINYYMINSFTVNENYFKEFRINLSSGRKFNNSEYSNMDENSEVPIILGYDYINVFKLHDKINFYDFSSQKKRVGNIIGFLSPNQYYLTTPINIKNMNTLDKSVLIPMVPINEVSINNSNKQRISYNNVCLYKLITESYYCKLSNSDINDIKQLSDKAGFFDINVINFNEFIDSFKDMFKQQQLSYLFILIIILLISLLSMITNIINSINDRKREFGIYFALGATKKYIIDLVLYEIFILVISSIFLSTIILKYISFFNVDSIDFKIYALICICAIVLCIVISFIPIYKLKNTPMSSLLKEE